MSRGMRRIRLALTALAVAVGALVLPAAAQAGCLVEYNDCAGCARETMRKAIEDYSLSGIRQSNLELWDCAIDLNHCVFFAQHHSYPCSR